LAGIGEGEKEGEVGFAGALPEGSWESRWAVASRWLGVDQREEEEKRRGRNLGKITSGSLPHGSNRIGQREEADAATVQRVKREGWLGKSFSLVDLQERKRKE
jgi:hypothetical protein